MSGETHFATPYWLLNEAKDREMDFSVVLAAADLQEISIQNIGKLIGDNDVVINSTLTVKNDKCAEFSIKASSQKSWDLFQKLLAIAENKFFDVTVLPIATRKKKLLVCDMDSTIVASETLDDVAEKIGIGKQVSEITARAMAGDLDFRQALNERVGLLIGLPEEIFSEIVETVQFNPGAETLLRLSKQNKIRTVLVSGGFEPIVNSVANKLGFDRYVCNRLDTSDGKLSGKVLEPIVDASTKLNVLLEECRELAIKPEEACCIGDGANDLPMLQAAGLGIAYQGKTLLRRSIPYQINACGLDSALLMMGMAE